MRPARPSSSVLDLQRGAEWTEPRSYGSDGVVAKLVAIRSAPRRTRTNDDTPVARQQTRPRTHLNVLILLRDEEAITILGADLGPLVVCHFGSHRLPYNTVQHRP